MKDEDRMEPIPSNGAQLVRLSPGELVDLAPLGSVQITVFVMMLIAGIFQGYDNQALAYTAVAFSKGLGMTPAALAPAFTAGLFGMMAGAMISPAVVAIPLGHRWTPANIMLLPVAPALVCAVGILYATPLAVGNKTTYVSTGGQSHNSTWRNEMSSTASLTVNKRTLTVRDAVFDLLRELDLRTMFRNPGSTELAFLTPWPEDGIGRALSSRKATETLS